MRRIKEHYYYLPNFPRHSSSCEPLRPKKKRFLLSPSPFPTSANESRARSRADYHKRGNNKTRDRSMNYFARDAEMPMPEIVAFCDFSTSRNSSPLELLLPVRPLESSLGGKKGNPAAAVIRVNKLLGSIIAHLVSCISRERNALNSLMPRLVELNRQEEVCFKRRNLRHYGFLRDSFNEHDGNSATRLPLVSRHPRTSAP